MLRRFRRLFVCLFAIAAAFAVQLASALTAPTPAQISPAGDICHDYPDVVVTSPGSTALAAWMGYNFSTDQDEIYTATLSGTTWQSAVATGITGDLFTPRLGNAGVDQAWIVWAQQVSGNWDLYARPFSGGSATRLTTHAGSDTNPATASDPSSGRFFVVWQGFRSGKSAIFLKVCQGGVWGSTKTVSQPAANEWFPKAAVDSTGRLWIAWDSYRDGNYDIYLRSYSAASDSFGPEIQVTANPKYEANVSIACDSDNRVWMAWEIGAANWTKDQGSLTNESRLTAPPGQRFLATRRVAVGVYDGAVQTTSAWIGSLYSSFDNTFDPIVAVDSHDRPWVFHARRLTYGTGTNSGWCGWQYAMTRYNLTAWDAAVTVPTSLARIERKMVAASYDSSRLVALWHVDGRWKGTGSQARDLRHGPPDGSRIYAALVDVPSVADADPSLTAPTADPPVNPTHPNEVADIAAVRAYAPTINGKTYHVLRGDFHRHNDVSWDGNGDSSAEDLFRYAVDVATLDFVMPSDHHTQLLAFKNQYDPLYPNWNFYPWRRLQKYDDMYYSPGVLMPFYGYERSRSYPDGHRNVVYPTRSARGDWIVPSTDTLPLGYDETFLWNQVKPRGGITIPHTPGNNMGTSWDYDVDLGSETVVEIYQGCRYSYENYQVTPTFWPNVDRQTRPVGDGQYIRPDGYYFSMLSHRNPSGDFRNKLGIVCSSDHGSTHLSYGCVYVEQITRQGIIEAVKARHTYGAMDNIILDVRCGTAMMGDEIEMSAWPLLHIFVDAPKPLNQVAVIRDNEILYYWDPSFDPDPSRFEADFKDENCAPGYHYYYIRARQNDGADEGGGLRIDGTMAWSSPIWVHRLPSGVKGWWQDL